MNSIQFYFYFLYYNSRIPVGSASLLQQQFGFHVSTKREEDAVTKATSATPSTTTTATEAATPPSSWHPIYAVPLGIAFAVPVVQYEWYLFNEETQLAACMIMFTALVYKNFGATLGEMLEQDGKRIIEEANKTEDVILSTLKSKKEDLLLMQNIVQDAQDIHTLKEETYVKYNAAGKIKPLHEFKGQMERVLHMVATEEAAVTEKTKVALMEEATVAVTNELLTNKDLQKVSLDNAIAQLKGTKPGTDPVKQTFLQFFQWKANEAKKVDAAAETLAAREALVKKINAIAANEKFFFHLAPDGTPKMVV
jgi:Mitochondrial ATP synthase B chain precursor (ATP-synt_B)